MKNLLPILAALVIVATSANAYAASGFRLFLAPEGVENNTPLGGISPTLSNPAVDASGGPQRLYIWGQVLGGDANQLYTAVSFNVVTTGSAEVVGSHIWNYSNILVRWSANNPGTLQSGDLVDVRLACAPTGFFGVRDENFAGFDGQFDKVTVSTVLGWIEVQGNGEIFLQVGEIGIIRTGQTWDVVALGFGDSEVSGNSFNKGSTKAEAAVSTVVPCEPCDTDCGANGVVNAFDIEPFLDILFAGAQPCSSCGGDADDNGVVNAFDIAPFLSCLFGGEPPVGSQDTFRVFFDTSGNGSSHAAPHPGSGTLSYGNPVLPVGGGRLYIYGEFQEADQTVLSPNFDITIDGGTITGAWNYNGPGQDSLTGDNRWDFAAPNPVINPGGNSVSFTAGNLTHMGLKNGIFADLFDVQHDNTRDFGDTLLGYIDVEAAGMASVWLSVGQQGFALLGGDPNTSIAFGYDDAFVAAGGVGVRTQIADATVIACEPCDTTCNGVVDAFDIEPFFDILFAGAQPCNSCAGDVDDNGVADAFDIAPFLSCLFGGEPPVGSQDTFRVFFDTSGNDSSDAVPHPGSGTLSYGNPVLPAGGGRLYIYGEFQKADQTVLSPNFDITIDGGTITGAWNYNGPGQDTLTGDRRWDFAAPNPVINPAGNSVSFTAGNMTHIGLKNGAFADLFDVQHDNTRDFGDTLLGYIDVEAAGMASVWLSVGQQGFAIAGGTGPNDLILMGFGDAAVQAGGGSGRSAIPEATIPTLQAPNDDCLDAIEIFEGAVGLENANATVDGPPLPIECDDGSGLDFVGDVWFSYAATCSGTLTVSTCNQATFDTSLVAYTGDCGDLTLVACNDDADGCAGGTSQMEVPVTCGQSVLLRVGWGFGFLGNGTLSLTCNEEACPVSSADLNGDGVVDLRDYRLFQLEFGKP